MELDYGLLFVVATLLPLASFLVLFLGGRRWGRWGAYLATAAIGLSCVCSLIGAAAYFSLHQPHASHAGHAHAAHGHKGPTHNGHAQDGHAPDGHARDAHAQDAHASQHPVPHDHAPAKPSHDHPRHAPAWKGSIHWAWVGGTGDQPDMYLELGYYVDGLTVLMFVMVSFVATLIHIFSLGYMAEELQEVVEDHQAHVARKGRFARFFMFLSLFCFSMLNLILANNLFQVFVSWELVGICSYLLISFYYERHSASTAANKAFITNRIGDAGFIIGLLIFWTYFGTFNFEELFAQVRCPPVDAHGKNSLSGQIVRGRFVPEEDLGDRRYLAVVEFRLDLDRLRSDPPLAPETLEKLRPLEGVVFARAKHFRDALETALSAEEYAQLESRLLLSAARTVADGPAALLFPPRPGDHPHGVGPDLEKLDDGYGDGVYLSPAPKPHQYRWMPYWLLVLGGIGLFLGCVGKSAQFPLQVWLPDAMEGPTPVSALIHAATMVAAGVYLVGRAYPLFTPEVLLLIAYVGGITLFVAATIAIVQTDIKRVLAYSTVSQLGFMMLALGVGGWAAGLFHLLTHAFFKALLFLGSGSVIHGCHHEQDMTRMGGLYGKMRITAVTMLIGVLAIAGMPLFSGWYSKDAILAHSLSFVTLRPQHLLLFLLPLVTAALTAFYMFRLWFLTFTGRPRDEEVHAHAHESPWVMTVPLIVLAFFSITVAWGSNPLDVGGSALEHALHHEYPALLPDLTAEDQKKVATAAGNDQLLPALVAFQLDKNTYLRVAHLPGPHELAGALALLAAGLGIAMAFVVYFFGVLDPAQTKAQFASAFRFLWHKWYFDEAYDVLLVRPAHVVAGWARWFDLKVIDGIIDGLARWTVQVSQWDGRFDLGIIDGLVNLTADVVYAVGSWLRVFQTGSIRSYVLFLALAAVGIVAVLSYVVARAG
jgi:proton-translocating NADH-quinone oxidoreductase chain L